MATMPVPAAPENTGWGELEAYMLRANRTASAPNYTDLGRLHALALDIATDREYLDGLAKDLDGLTAEYACDLRDDEKLARA